MDSKHCPPRDCVSSRQMKHSIKLKKKEEERAEIGRNDSPGFKHQNLLQISESGCHLSAGPVHLGPLRKDQEPRQRDFETKASILTICSQKDWRSHMGTPKMLTRQLEVTLISCGNPGPGPKQPAAHTGGPVWTVCWKFCYQRTSRNK